MKGLGGKLWRAAAWGVASLWAGALCVALHYGWRALVADTFIVPSDSMQPTLLPGDRVKVDKTVFGARLYTSLDFTGGRMESVRTRGRRGLRRGDIVVFNYPIQAGKMGFKINYVYVKRCMALPGDSLSFADSRPVVDGRRMALGVEAEQDRLEATPDSLLTWGALRHVLIGHSGLGWTIKDMGPVYVPRRGDILRLDDWRKVAVYRLAIGWETGCEPVWDEARGCCLLDGEPLPYYRFRKDYYFMCGDHAVNSRDSRYWGFVPEEYVVGVVSEVVESIDRATGRERKERRGLSLLAGDER